MLSFNYAPTDRQTATRHSAIEPIEIEFRDRHFYFIGYSPQQRLALDYRIDRIDGSSLNGGQHLPPGMVHGATPLVFRYRLAAKLARGAISERRLFGNSRG